jgi:hypothetical protein
MADFLSTTSPRNRRLFRGLAAFMPIQLRRCSDQMYSSALLRNFGGLAQNHFKHYSALHCLSSTGTLASHVAMR